MIGHLAARAYLERHLPVASLLTGPPSVGKWTLAAHLAEHHRISQFDRWAVPHGFSIETVRLITDYTRRAPQGNVKLILARLDGSSRPALNALLKTLEEPPPYVRFLLVSTGATLPTVASRCMVFELGSLSEPELTQIYQQRGMNSTRAQRAARYAAGQVERGLTVDTAEGPRGLVVTLIRSLVTGDRDLFSNVFTGWDQAASDMLTTLITEAATQRWNEFSEVEAAGLHRNRALIWELIEALGRTPHARPRLGVRAALEPFLARR